MVYNLTNKDFDLRYSEVYGGYFISLSMDTKSLFADMPRSKVNVDISMQYGDKKIVGIDYNGFENFEIDTLTVEGSGKFYMLEKSLFNSKLQTLKRSKSISFEIASGAIDTSYSEVIL